MREKERKKERGAHENRQNIEEAREDKATQMICIWGGIRTGGNDLQIGLHLRGASKDDEHSAQQGRKQNSS